MPTDDARQKRKQRGIVLATLGLSLALAVMLGMKLSGLTRFLTFEQWILAVIGTAVVQVALWLVPRLELDRRLSWDPHFIYMPMVATALLLSAYTLLAPEGRVLVLLGWFIALLFTAGLAEFGPILALNTLMSAGYLLAVVRLAQITPVALSMEVAVAAVFHGAAGYAGLVFGRLRSERMERRQLRESLAEMAVTDALTGLPNRRYFEPILESELARIQRYGGTCALAMLDLDGFKRLNDTLGHLAGDEILRELADLLRGELRVSDVLTRYGGDEFALLMVNATLPEAYAIIDRLRHLVAVHIFSGPPESPALRLTLSAGVAACPAHALTFNGLLEAADTALYDAKAAGRNTVRQASGAL